MPDWKGQCDALDDSKFLYTGGTSKFVLAAGQGVLEECGPASEVFVKYS